MPTALIITGSVVAGLLVLGLFFRVVLAAVSRKMEAAVSDRFNREDILAASTRANFLGRRTKGGRQIRGNGALVLTRDGIYFLRAVPRKEYQVPLSAITEVSLPRAFNGKSVMAQLLCIHYQGPDGPDAMAWALRKPADWKAAVEAHAGLSAAAGS